MIINTKVTMVYYSKTDTNWHSNKKTKEEILSDTAEILQKDLSRFYGISDLVVTVEEVKDTELQTEPEQTSPSEEAPEERSKSGRKPKA